jgi:hypothetical protein
MKLKRRRDPILDALYSQRNFQVRLAEHLGVSIQAVNGWPQVPLNRVGQVAQFAGKRPIDIRPDRPDLFSE